MLCPLKYVHDCATDHIEDWPDCTRKFGDAERTIRLVFVSCILLVTHSSSQAARVILLSPRVALGIAAEGDRRRGQPSIAQRYGITSVTYEMIVYIACLVRSSIILPVWF